MLKIFITYILLIVFPIIISCSSFDKEKSLKKTTLHLNLKETTQDVNLYELSKTIKFAEIPKTVPYSTKKNTRFANLILEDSLVVLHTFKHNYLPIDKIDWTENPENNKTWQLYFENLFFVSVLNHAYYETNEKTYHKKAKKYISSYIKLHPTFKEKTSEFSWNDHATAFRTLHILQTISNELKSEKPDIDFIKKTFEHISLNVQFMLNSENYRIHNHSLMMDRTLLYLAKITQSNLSLSEDLFNTASSRALDNFNKIIDDTGLAKEHSTTYHIFNHNLYNSIFELIDNEELNPSILLKRLKKNDILLQLVKPDLTFPLWGDSQKETLSAELAENFGNDKRVLDVIKGNRVLSSAVNFQNNIAVLRSQEKDSGYIALFANYYSRVHKHSDDLSFIFQTLGVDILTDQGYFGYDDTYRPFLTSVFGHNTLAVNDKNYTIGKPGQYSKLTGYSKINDVEIVEAEHTMYDSIIVKRTLYFIHPNVIILDDKAESNDSNAIKKISQQFNFGKEALPFKVANNKTEILFPENINVIVKTFSKQASLSKEESFYSRRPNSVVPIQQVKVTRKNSTLRSMIYVTSNTYKTPVIDVQIKNNTIQYSKGGKKHILEM